MSKQNILLVDKDDEITNQISTKLIEMGHCAFITISGNKAIDLFDDFTFDIVISDLEMRDGDGLKLLEYSNAQLHRPKFYFLSKEPGNISIIDCIRAGAIDFLIKPITIDEIIKRINL